MGGPGACTRHGTARHGTAEAAVVAVHSSKSASRENLQAKAVSTHHTKCDATYTVVRCR